MIKPRLTIRRLMILIAVCGVLAWVAASSRIVIAQGDRKTGVVRLDLPLRFIFEFSWNTSWGSFYIGLTQAGHPS